MKSNIQLRVISVSLLVYLAFATSCSHDNPAPKTPYEKASSVTGGVMYDKFWASEAGLTLSEENLDLFNENADFFRCKQCHAWDGLGNKGSYIGRGANASRPNVSSLNLYEMSQQMTKEELFDALKKTTDRRDLSYDLSQYDPTSNSTEGDKMPNLTQLIGDKELWNLVKFMKEDMFDVSQLYDGTYEGAYPTGIASYANIGLDGNATNGNTYYSTNCASCHGVDGTDISLSGKGVGYFAREKSYELQHKTKYGQLGSNMGPTDPTTTLDEMRDLYKALSDETAFPGERQTPISFAVNIQTAIFNPKCAGCHNNTSPQGGLDLTEGNAYNNINNATYINLTMPSSSLIYTKPLASHGGTYSPGEADNVLKWIEQGAIDN